jgi:hypothetical protein
MLRSGPAVLHLEYDKVELQIDPGGIFRDLSNKDLFMVMCGELHKDPFRFQNDTDIHTAMENLFGFLSLQECKRYTSDSDIWANFRKKNASSPAPATLSWTAPKRYTATEITNLRQNAYNKGFEHAKAAAQSVCSTTLPQMAPQLGRRQLLKLAEYMNFDRSSKPGERREYRRVNGKSFRLAIVGNLTYAHILAKQSQPPYVIHGIPSPRSQLFVGFNTASRERIVTMSGFPLEWNEDDVRQALRDSHMPTPNSVSRTRVGSSGETYSWRFSFDTQSDAEYVAGTPVTLERENGKSKRLSVWHHAHDFDDKRHGCAADVASLLSSLVDRNPLLAADASPLLGTWSDGLTVRGSHLNSGLVFAIHREGSTQFPPVFFKTYLKSVSTFSRRFQYADGST